MQDTTVLTASIGAAPDDPESLTMAASHAPGFDLVGLCTEGCDAAPPDNFGAPVYDDYHVMLQDPRIELIIVEGPIDKRRDFAVRALNAGRNVLCAVPFAETAADGVRIMKTALNKDLIATSFFSWRNHPDFMAARTAVERAGLRPLEELYISAEAPASAWESSLLSVMDQANLLVRTEFASVAVHPGAAGLLYLPLRDDNAVIVRLGERVGLCLPPFAFAGRGAQAHVIDGVAHLVDGDSSDTVAAPPATDFWSNLRDAIRGKAEVACHPVDIVRAMRLTEAALDALETGLPGTV